MHLVQFYNENVYSPKNSATISVDPFKVMHCLTVDAILKLRAEAQVNVKVNFSEWIPSVSWVAQSSRVRRARDYRVYFWILFSLWACYVLSHWIGERGRERALI